MCNDLKCWFKHPLALAFCLTQLSTQVQNLTPNSVVTSYLGLGDPYEVAITQGCQIIHIILSSSPAWGFELVIGSVQEERARTWGCNQSGWVGGRGQSCGQGFGSGRHSHTLTAAQQSKQQPGKRPNNEVKAIACPVTATSVMHIT